MIVSDIQDCSATRILLALTQNGTMTYEALKDNTGLSIASIKRGMKELRSLGFAKVMTPEAGRKLLVKATVPQPIVGSVYDMAVAADESGDKEQKIKDTRFFASIVV